MITTYHTPGSMRESGEIWLGRQGEKFARRLVFDCEEWLAEYTDAQIELSVTPPKGEMYFAVLQEDGNKRYWDVTSADTTYDGRAYLELILRDTTTGTIIKSATAAAKISRSRSAQEPAEPPEPHVPWWEKIMELIAGGSGGGSGTPAVSPTITLTAIEGGTRLTVNDVNGTRSADIMNGAAGPEGPQGKTGATGATGAQGVAGRGIVDITSNVYDGTPVDVKYSDGTGTVFYVKNGRDGVTPDVDVFPAIDGSGTTVQIGDVSFFIPHGKDGKDGAPGESYKLSAADKDEIAEKIVEGGGVTDAQIEAAVDKYMAKNPSAGITSAQIEALNGMFAIATYKTDPTEAYAAFKAAFGITDSTDPDEPDEPTEPDKTTYAITTILTGCTISNDAASITEGESYSATLTAADGYTLDGATVAITMGGTDITASAYSDGVIAIASVTGDIVINAEAVEDENSGVNNLDPSNVLMSDTAEMAVWPDLLDGLEKVYVYGTASNQYNKKVNVKARYTPGWSYVWIANGVTINTANAGTDPVVTAGYDHFDDGGYIVFEIDVPALLATRQSLLDSGELDATKDGNFAIGLTAMASGSTQYLLKSYVD